MAGTGSSRFHKAVITGGAAAASLFLCAASWADTITLKNGKELKGLVVERHSDRVIFSTEKGELPILLKGIKNISYDNPEQNFLEVGKGYEAEGKLGEALAYYEKALEVNPDFQEAKSAAVGVRNRFWSKSAEGPRNEMEKQQVVYDSWGQGKPVDDLISKKVVVQSETLEKNFGITLERKGDWIRIRSISPHGAAAAAGLKRYDRLVSIDGSSLRYLGVDVVTNDFLVPAYSNFSLEFERDCFVVKEGEIKKVSDLGLKLKFVYEGLVVSFIEANGPADVSGIKEKDLVTHVNGISTRYMPIGKVQKLILDTPGEKVAFSVRRTILLARK